MPFARFDSLPALAPSKRTKEGYLRVEGYVTRAGVFPYRQADGTVRRELRHPDDVFLADSLETLDLVPVTNGHPVGGLLTPENAVELSVGATASPRRVDDWVKASLKVTDAGTIAEMEAGKQALSCGYEIERLDMTPGVWNGQHYDARQIGISYNHLALVPAGRAGEAARLRLDSLDGSAQVCDEETVTPVPSSETRTMLKKVKLDGVEFEVEEALASAVEKANARLDIATEKLAALEAQDQAAKKAAAETALAKLRVDAKSVVDDAVTAARIDVAQDEAAIKRLVLAKLAPKLDLTGRSDEYVAARYDAALEKTVTESLAAPLAAVTAAAQARVDDAALDSDAIRKRNEDQAKNAWRTAKGL